MPMDTPRVPSGEFELAFLNDYYGGNSTLYLTDQ